MRVAPGHPRIRMRLLPFHDRSHGSGGTDPYAEPGTLAEIGRFAPGAQVGLRRGRIGNQGENVTAQTVERFCPTGGAGGCGRLQGPAALTEPGTVPADWECGASTRRCTAASHASRFALAYGRGKLGGTIGAGWSWEGSFGSASIAARGRPDASFSFRAVIPSVDGPRVL